MHYPKRHSHFAHRFVRLLFKSCACQDLGRDVVCLLVHIAHTEDAARYQGPVKFWNGQLMETLGFRSPKQLTQSRKAAVTAGWLQYEREHDRAVGRYWCLIPDRVAKFDDSPIEDDSLSTDGTQNGKLSADGTGTGTGTGKPSYPIPTPNPNTPASKNAEPQNGKNRKPQKKTYTDEFRRWWAAYPKKVDKKNAAKAFPGVVKELINDDDHPGIQTAEDAVKFLIEAAERYAHHVRNTERQYIKGPEGWLNAGKYHDEPAASSGNATADPKPTKPQKSLVFDPRENAPRK